jgi:membrane fusion protein, heavy metal efflux system
VPESAHQILLSARPRCAVRLIAPIALGCIVLWLTACGDKSGAEAASQPAQNQTPVVQTQAVQQQLVPDTLELAAKVQPDPASVVRVFPPAGGRVVQVKVRPGDNVRAGQVIAELQSSDVAQARTDYQKALAEYDRASRILARSQTLYEHKAIAEKDLQDAQINAQEASADLERAKEHLHVLGVPLDGSYDVLRVLAPRSGIILDLGAAAGEFSKALDAPAPVATIADLSTVWVVGDVYEKDLATVHLGSPVDVVVAAYPGQTFRGKLNALSGNIDPNTRTLKVRVDIANPKQLLKPEMFATIRVIRADRPVIVLPTTAVIREGDQSSVYVEQSPGKFEKRSVQLARTSGAQVEIAAGLKPGEHVAVQGAALLRGGGETD